MNSTNCLGLIWDQQRARNSTLHSTRLHNTPTLWLADRLVQTLSTAPVVVKSRFFETPSTTSEKINCMAITEMTSTEPFLPSFSLSCDQVLFMQSGNTEVLATPTVASVVDSTTVVNASFCCFCC